MAGTVIERILVDVVDNVKFTSGEKSIAKAA